MPVRFVARIVIGLVALYAGPFHAAYAADATVSFKRDVAPILVKNCVACHGVTDYKGDYQLHTFAALQKAGDSGLAAITAGKLDDSELYRLVASRDEAERMPKDADPLPAEQLAVIKRWIEQGAKFDGPDPAALLTTLLPPRVHAAPPEKYRTALPVIALAFSPDGKELAVGGYHEIIVWNPDNGELLRRIKNVDERVYALAWRPGNGADQPALLAAACGTPGQSGEVALYDPAAGKLVRSLATMPDVALAVAFSPDGKRLAAGAADRSLRVFDVAVGKQELLLDDHADWVLAVGWNRDGSRFVSGSRDKSAKVFDAQRGEVVVAYTGHAEIVFSTSFTADGKQVLSGGGDKKVHLWNPTDGKQATTFTGFASDVFRIVVREGLLYACSDKTIREFTIAEPKKAPRTFPMHAEPIFSLDVHAERKLVASGSFDGEVRVWNLADLKPITTFLAAPGLSPAQTVKK